MVFRLRNMSWCSRKVYRAVSRRIFEHLLHNLNIHLQDGRLTGRISNRQGLMLFLYHMVTSESYRDIEQQFGYPHSDMARTVTRIAQTLAGSAEQAVQGFRSLEERRVASLQILTTQDRYLQGVTMILDGHHVPVEQASFLANFFHRFYSFKLQRPALSFQVIISLDEYIVFVSQAFPAATPDITCVAQCANQIRATLNIDQRERILADKGFQGLETRYGFRSVLPDRRPSNGQLQVWQIIRNRELEAFRRGRIERVFGYINTHFAVLAQPVRHRGSLHVVRQLFLIACWIYNLQLLYRNNR